MALLSVGNAFLPLAVNYFSIFWLVWVLAILFFFALLLQIRNNTRRTAEAVERLAERRERGDDPDR